MLGFQPTSTVRITSNNTQSTNTPSAATAECPLSQLKVRDQGTIVAMEGVPAELAQICAMGLTPGTFVRVVRAGSPTIVKFGGIEGLGGCTRIGLAKLHADGILVTRNSSIP